VSAHVSLTVLRTPIAVCRLPAGTAPPPWTSDAIAFLSVTRTPDELSIACDASAVPNDLPAERGLRALRVDGPLAHDLVGVTASLAVPLAAAGVPIFPIATYDTDYVLVRERDLARASTALTTAGHRVAHEGGTDG
jgi:hypothetical protein